MEIFSNEKKGKKKQYISVIWGCSWYYSIKLIWAVPITIGGALHL